MLTKRLLIVAMLCSALGAQTRINLGPPTQVQGTLSAQNGGTGNTANGNAGQVLIGDGAGHFAPADPLISFNYVGGGLGLINNQSANVTFVGAAQRMPIFTVTGTLYVTFTGITGSPSGCTVQIINYDSFGHGINNGSAIALTVANGTTTFNVASVAPLLTADQLSATYACSGAYPSTGTITADFVPMMAATTGGGGGGGTSSNFASAFPSTGTAAGFKDSSGNMAAGNLNASGALKVDGSAVTQPVSGTVTTTPPANASSNVTQFGGTNVSTGTGTGGAGIPRVTVSSDSFPTTQAVSGTVTANIGTTNGLALDASVTNPEFTAGTTTAPAKVGLVGGKTTDATPQYQPLPLTNGGAAVKTDASATTQPISGTVTTTPPANASTNVAQFGGTNVVTGTGASAAGVPRVTISNDSSLAANQSVNTAQFGGTNVSTGTGTGGAGIPRVTVSSDSFPATQAISAASLPLPTGAATAANQTNGTQQTQVTNFPATQAVAVNAPLPAGSNNIGQVASNVNQINGWPIVTAKPGVPLYANADGYGRPLSSTLGALNVAQQGTVTTQFANQNIGAAWNSATLTGTTLILSTLNASAVEVSLDNSIGLVTGGGVTFEAQDNNSGTWHTVPGIQTGSSFGVPGVGTWAITVTVGAAMHQAWVIPVAGYSQFRARLSSSISGTGTLAVFAQTTANGSQVIHLAAEGATGQSLASAGSQIPIVQIGGQNASNNLEPITFDTGNNLNVALPEGVDSLTSGVSTTWTSATSTNATLNMNTGAIPVPGATTVLVLVNSSNVTDGSLIFEEKGFLGFPYVPVPGVSISTGIFQSPILYASNNGNFAFLFSISGAVQDFQVRLLTPLVGAGSVNVAISIQGMGVPPRHVNLVSLAGLPISLTSQGGTGALPIAGNTPDQLSRPVALSAEGAQYVKPMGLPLQPCNPVRTTNCQHF